MSAPKVVFLFSGKRKSGKDYVAEKLCQIIGPENVSILRISAPLKQQYAKEHNLDYNRLLDSSSYKEQHRLDMIRWGEEIRAKTPGYFCSLASESASTAGQSKPIWIISDCRRPTDIEYFTSHYRCVSVRICASEETRKGRGWTYTPEVDDAPSECGLDSYPCDYHVTNDADEVVLMNDLDRLVKITKHEMT